MPGAVGETVPDRLAPATLGNCSLDLVSGGGCSPEKALRKAPVHRHALLLDTYRTGHPLVKALTCVPGSPTVPACEQPLRRGATLAAGRALDHAHGVVAMVVPGC